MTRSISALLPDPDHAAAAGLGFWSALLTSLLAVVTLSIAVFTAPISGPFCQTDCISYPFSDIASRAPRDYYWMYPAILLMLTFVVLAVALHHCAPQPERVYGEVALAFALVAAALVAADYYIQVAVLQPSTVKGETEGIALITQYNPHGVFIALEELGYLVMSLSFLFGSHVFSGVTALERVLRWFLLVGTLVGLAAFVALYSIYGFDLEYRFEVTIIGINYLILAISGALLAPWFRRIQREPVA